MVKRLAGLAFAVGEVLGDVVLEVLQLALGNEHVRVRDGTGLTHAEQLDVLGLVAQALECQLYVRLALEFDLQADAALHATVKLGLRRLRH